MFMMRYNNIIIFRTHEKFYEWMGEACLKRKKYTNFIYAFALKTHETNFCELHGASNQYILSFTLNMYFVVLNLLNKVMNICVHLFSFFFCCAPNLLREHFSNYLECYVTETVTMARDKCNLNSLLWPFLSMLDGHNYCQVDAK